MMITKLNFLPFLVALFSLAFIACESEEIESEIEETENFLNLVEGEIERFRGHDDCLSLVFPISLVFPDGTQNFETAEDLKTGLKDYYEVNGREAEKPIIEFPISVITEDGTEEEISDQESLTMLKNNCKSDRGDKDEGRNEKCFTLVYPLSYSFPDGSTETFEDKESKRIALQAYYEVNGREAEKPDLVFPVTLLLDDETESVIENQEALETIKEECDHNDRNDKEEKEKCFSLLYPLTFQFGNEPVQTFETREAFRTALRAYYEENGREAEKPELVYPVTVQFEDETQAIAESEEDLEVLKETCDD